MSFVCEPRQRFGYETWAGGPRDGVGICFIHTSQDKIDSNNNNKDKDEYIQDLFKDRIAPVIPFNRNLIKGSCLNYTDRISKAKFLKQ